MVSPVFTALPAMWNATITDMTNMSRIHGVNHILPSAFKIDDYRQISVDDGQVSS